MILASSKIWITDYVTWNAFFLFLRDFVLAFSGLFFGFIQGVSKVTPDFIQLKSQWIFFYDIFYIYAFSNHF